MDNSDSPTLNEHKNSNRFTLTREQLYQKVWSTPAVKLAKEFGISDVAIGNICVKFNVPKPPSAYWVSLRLGKDVHKVPLPEKPQGRSDEILITPTSPKKPFILQNPDIIKKIEAEKQPVNKINVNKYLIDPHPLVLDAKKYFSEAVIDPHGRLSTSRSGSNIDIQVSRNCVNRALLIMDALIKALEKRGFPVRGGHERTFHTIVTIAGQDVRVRMIERVHREELSPGIEKNSKSSLFSSHRYNRTSTGILQFEIYPFWIDNCKRKWADQPDSPLESQLNDIIIGIITCAEHIRLDSIEREEIYRQRLEKDLQRREVEKRELEESNRFKLLEEQSTLWHKCRILREYINACEKYLIDKNGSITPGSIEAQWLQWANAYIDKLDPVNPERINIILNEFVGRNT